MGEKIRFIFFRFFRKLVCYRYVSFGAKWCWMVLGDWLGGCFSLLNFVGTGPAAKHSSCYYSSGVGIGGGAVQPTDIDKYFILLSTTSRWAITHPAGHGLYKEIPAKTSRQNRTGLDQVWNFKMFHLRLHPGDGGFDIWKSRTLLAQCHRAAVSTQDGRENLRTENREGPEDTVHARRVKRADGKVVRKPVSHYYFQTARQCSSQLQAPFKSCHSRSEWKIVFF